MNILASEYNLKHQALEVYVAGCMRKCPGCHNPETWGFNQGTSASAWLQQNRWKLVQPIVHRVWILGGEPLDQPMPDLIRFMRTVGGLVPEVWLFTSYEAELIPENVLKLCTVIKTGAYREDLPATVDNRFGLTLSSSNQKLLKLQ